MVKNKCGVISNCAAVSPRGSGHIFVVDTVCLLLFGAYAPIALLLSRGIGNFMSHRVLPRCPGCTCPNLPVPGCTSLICFVLFCFVLFLGLVLLRWRAGAT